MRFVEVDYRGQERIEEWCPPGYQSATNNQMELQACILALREAKRLGLGLGLQRIVVHTDSMYVSGNFTNALYRWPRNGWLKSGGGPVLNADLWKTLSRLVRNAGRPVDIEWVKGHSKDEHNRAVDRIARRSASVSSNPPLAPVTVRRKLSSESVAIGSVGMHGQRLTIRIITDEWLGAQKLYKLKYEVMSKASRYFKKVDQIYSAELLKAGHEYYVKVSDEPENPRIVKVFRENKR